MPLTYILTPRHPLPSVFLQTADNVAKPQRRVLTREVPPSLPIFRRSWRKENTITRTCGNAGNEGNAKTLEHTESRNTGVLEARHASVLWHRPPRDTRTVNEWFDRKEQHVDSFQTGILDATYNDAVLNISRRCGKCQTKLISTRRR